MTAGDWGCRRASARWSCSVRPTRIVVVVCVDEALVGLLQRYLEGYKLVRARDMAEGLSLAENLKAVAVAVDTMVDVNSLTIRLPVISFAWPTGERRPWRWAPSVF